MSLRWIPFTNYWICFYLYTRKRVQSLIQPRIQLHSLPAPSPLALRTGEGVAPSKVLNTQRSKSLQEGSPFLRGT